MKFNQHRPQTAAAVGVFFFPKQFTVRGSQCFKEWSPWWLVSHFLSFVSQFLSGWVWLVSHVLSFVSNFSSFVSQFFSFVSQAGCLWWGSPLACLPHPFICLPLLFIVSWFVSHFLSFVSSISIHSSPMRFLSFCLSGLVPALVFSALSAGTG